MALNKKQKEVFKKVQADTASAVGYSMVEQGSDLSALVAAGLVDVNEAIRDGNLVAAKTKDNSVQVNGAAPDEIESDINLSDLRERDRQMLEQFKIEDELPMAEPKRGGLRNENYPFSFLKVGQSFAVPVTAEIPEPWKSLASSVTGASRRHTKQKGVPVKFRIRRVFAGDKYPNGKQETVTGARVYRIE